MARLIYILRWRLCQCLSALAWTAMPQPHKAKLLERSNHLWKKYQEEYHDEARLLDSPNHFRIADLRPDNERRVEKGPS